jgi:hypothetical protein
MRNTLLPRMLWLTQISLLMVVIASCALRSKNEIIKSPFPPQIFSQVEPASYCLKFEKIKNCLDGEKENGRATGDYNKFAQLRSLVSGSESPLGKCDFFNTLHNVLYEKKVLSDCNECKAEEIRLLERIKKNHDGLFTFGTGTDTYQKELSRAVNQFRNAVGSDGRVSVSFENPASLSMSTRPLPAEKEPGNAYNKLSERAQAALVDYAALYKDPADKMKPEKAVENLLTLIGKTKEPQYSETRRVELTVSSVLNSATVDDRFDHVTAYLSVPALPNTINGDISLEKEFLYNLQLRILARSTSEDRCAYLASDVRNAVDDIGVRIEVVDSLRTEPATIQLGKITSSAGLSVSTPGEYDAVATSGDVTRTVKLAPSAGVSLNASREVAIAKELDKRSFWINPERTLLRITQRGMQEATISGSMSSAITIKVPKINLYEISINEDEEISQKDRTSDASGKTEKNDGSKKSKLVPYKSGPSRGAGGKETQSMSDKKIFPLILLNVEQPLYASVEALGFVVGTVRIAEQPAMLFKKEADGVLFSTTDGPFRLKLWNNDRVVWSLDLPDLLPNVKLYEDDKSKNDRAVLGTFVVYNKNIYGDNEALFEDKMMKFVKLIKRDNKYQLKKHAAKQDGTPVPYYVLLSCEDTVAHRRSLLGMEEPNIGEFWFGVHINGAPISTASWNKLDDEIGDCGKKNKGQL